ncbi:microtubule-associated protein RP/EB family member 1 [Drosophila santomea]|uniref:microtubule-associated protein RP/EB family member 1 n=1 Tax=Drosophila santomea TaxID=129105 RepID=UPI0019542BCA|nr:microtubule-associated protein RP/EB family member 1 [Drosophila santomea]XP_039497585.1 microtubule-associated protein RP/EB family member 1 [Drosophila santomea]
MAPSVACNVTVTHNSLIQWSRGEILEWFNETLKCSLTKIEHLCTGAAYCNLMHMLFPDVINLKRVKFVSNQEYEFVANFKELQKALNKVKVSPPVQVNKLVKGRCVDNFEFAVWFRHFYKANYNSERCMGYDVLAARDHQDIGLGSSRSTTPVSASKNRRGIEIVKISPRRDQKKAGYEDYIETNRNQSPAFKKDDRNQRSTTAEAPELKPKPGKFPQNQSNSKDKTTKAAMPAKEPTRRSKRSVRIPPLDLTGICADTPRPMTPAMGTKSTKKPGRHNGTGPTGQTMTETRKPSVQNASDPEKKEAAKRIEAANERIQRLEAEKRSYEFKPEANGPRMEQLGVGREQKSLHKTNPNQNPARPSNNQNANNQNNNTQDIHREIVEIFKSPVYFTEKSSKPKMRDDDDDDGAIPVKLSKNLTKILTSCEVTNEQLLAEVVLHCSLNLYIKNTDDDDDVDIAVQTTSMDAACGSQTGEAAKHL